MTEIYCCSDSHSDGSNTRSYFSTKRKAKVFAREMNKVEWGDYRERFNNKDDLIRDWTRSHSDWIWHEYRFTVYSIELDPKPIKESARDEWLRENPY